MKFLSIIFFGKSDQQLYVLAILMSFLSVSQVYAQQSGGASENIDYSSITKNKQIPVSEGAILEGRQLFGQHCSRCHTMGKQITGPALASVQDRRPLLWLISFIQNSQKVISEGDEYANFLFDQYNGYVMPDFEFLEKKDIINILAYIKDESAAESHVAGFNGKAVPTDNIPADELPPSRVEPSADPSGETGSEDYIIYGMMALLVFVLGLVLVRAFGITGK